MHMITTCGMYMIHDLSKFVDDRYLVLKRHETSDYTTDSVDQDHRSDRDLIIVRIGRLVVDYGLGSDMYACTPPHKPFY